METKLNENEVCEKLFHMNETVYNYRVNMNTTIKDFINKIPNILDVIKCVENIEMQMKERGLSEEYKSKISNLSKDTIDIILMEIFDIKSINELDKYFNK